MTNPNPEANKAPKSDNRKGVPLPGSHPDTRYIDNTVKPVAR